MLEKWNKEKGSHNKCFYVAIVALFSADWKKIWNNELKFISFIQFKIIHVLKKTTKKTTYSQKEIYHIFMVNISCSYMAEYFYSNLYSINMYIKTQKYHLASLPLPVSK